VTPEEYAKLLVAAQRGKLSLTLKSKKQG